jgi:hypothetical protein
VGRDVRHLALLTGNAGRLSNLFLF